MTALRFADGNVDPRRDVSARATDTIESDETPSRLHRKIRRASGGARPNVAAGARSADTPRR